MNSKKEIKKYNLNHCSGTTFIEALTVLFIFSLITVTFYSVFSVGTRYIQDAKNRLIAISLANEKIEIARNLNYDKIGIIGDYSEAALAEDEYVGRSGRNFHIHTTVDEIDDDFDGTYSGGDTVPNDYKRVTIEVSWENSGLGLGEVTLVSRFAPQGLEVMNPGDGILSINLFSDQPGGSGIPDSDVHIVNSETGLDVYRKTDSSGNVILVGEKVTDSIQKYEITGVKDGYETVSTLPPYPLTAYAPVDTHASVVSGALNVANIVQNELANIKVITRDYLDQPVSDVDFNLVGGRILGYEVIIDPADPGPPDPVYNFDSGSVKTDSNGEELFENLSPGSYVFSLLDPSLSDYEIIDADPYWPFSLASADETLNMTVRLAPKNATSILIEVLSLADDLPINGAAVRLTNTAGYDQTLTATEQGMVFFPVSSDVFIGGDYHINIQADGFSEKDLDVTVNVNELKKEIVKLSAP